MSILDFGAKAVVTFKADVSDMKRGLKELQGEEKKLAEQQLASAEARNKSLTDWAEQIGKVSLAIGAFAGVAKLAIDGYKDGIKDAQAQGAIFGISLDKLKDAAHGLKTENELLAWAAKTANAAFKNSEGDLVTAQQAMLALTRQGRDAAEVQDKVTTALTTLRVRGLQELGIYVDTTRVKFDASGEVVDDYNNKLLLHQKILEALKVKADSVKDGQDEIGDSMQRSAVKLQDAWDDLKKGLGQLVVAMQPLLDALGQAVGLVAKIAQYVPGGLGGRGSTALGEIGIGASITGNGGGGALGDAAASLEASLKDTGKGGVFDFDALVQKQLAQRIADRQIALLKYLGARPEIEMPEDIITRNAKKEAELSADAVHQLILRTFREYDAANTNASGGSATGGLGASAGTGDLSQRSLTFGGRELTSYTTGQGGGINEAMDRLREQGDAYNEMMANAAKNYDAFMSKRQDTLLEKTFGPVGDFDLYKKAFDGLTGAVGSAYDAWASGSESAAKAFKQFIGQSVAAVGKQMAVEAVKEGAYALGHLAIGDFGGAAAHATAAAEFAAGAVLAGVVAQELGTGGGSTPTKGASGGAHPGTGGGGSGATGSAGPTQVTVVYGDPFAMSTPREQALRAGKLVSIGLASANGTVVQDS